MSSFELLRLSVALTLSRLAPRELRRRLARFLYDYDSRRNRGIDLVIGYPHATAGRFLANSKEFIGWNILFLGEYETGTNLVLKKLVRPGDTVVEAGANNGSETILLGKLVQPGGRIFAFEPVPHVARRLDLNIRLNDLQSVVTVRQQAMGESVGKIVLNLSAETTANQGMSSRFAFRGATQTVIADQVTLDELAHEQGLAALHLLKMDIQGGEHALLCGGERTIRRFRPVILTEASPPEGEEMNAYLGRLHKRLIRLGYSVESVNEEGQAVPLAQECLSEGMWLAKPI